MTGRPPMPPVWLAATLLALGLHAAAVAAIVADRTRDTEDALGAPAIEIGLELTTPARENSDLPPGPEAEDAAASAAMAEQKAKTEDEDLPTAKPTETEDPDRVVAPDRTKQKDDTPKVTESKAAPTADSVASEAAAPPHVEEARVAERSTAPAQGVGESAALLRATWQKQLVAHLARFKRYPGGAARRTVEIVVTFTLDRTGHVVASSLRKPSGDPAFDMAAMTMMAKADPVPPPPPVIADDGLTFSLPVIFRDRKK